MPASDTLRIDPRVNEILGMTNKQISRSNISKIIEKAGEAGYKVMFRSFVDSENPGLEFTVLDNTQNTVDQ